MIVGWFRVHGCFYSLSVPGGIYLNFIQWNWIIIVGYLLISMTHWYQQSTIQLYMYDNVSNTTLVQRKYHLFMKHWWSPSNTYRTDDNRNNPLYIILIWRYLSRWISSEILWNNGFILISVSGGERRDSVVNNDTGEFEIKTFGELSLPGVALY